MTARFRVVGQFDRSCPQEAMVEIERSTGIMTIRPKGARRGGERAYAVPLAAAAELVVQRMIKARVAERARMKKKRRNR